MYGCTVFDCKHFVLLHLDFCSTFIMVCQCKNRKSPLIFIMANNQNIVELCPVTLYFELTHATIFFLSFALTYISILNRFILGTKNVNSNFVLFHYFSTNRLKLGILCFNSTLMICTIAVHDCVTITHFPYMESHFLSPMCPNVKP